MKYIFLIISIVFVSINLTAQAVDSIPIQVTSGADASLKKTRLIHFNFKKNTGPKVYNPKMALLWSIIPGGGQVYNRRWWKVPLVFSAFTGIAAVWNFNQSNYDRFNTAYHLALAGETHEFTGIIDDRSRLKSFRDGFNKSRQTTVFYMIAVYGLQSIEAYVDSQLRDFDISDDLSHFQIQPIIIPVSYANKNPVLGLEMRYGF